MDKSELRDRIQSLLGGHTDQINAALGIDELTPQLEAATIVEECLDVYRRAPGGSEVERRAVEKMFDFIATVGECRAVFLHHLWNDPLIAKRAILKIAELLQKEESATA